MVPRRVPPKRLERLTRCELSKPIETVLNACSARGLKVVTKSGWHRCAHPCSPEGDTRLSFVFQEQGDGVVCARSFKGYSTEEALTALGLKWADLFPPKVTKYEYRDRKGTPVGVVERTPEKNFYQSRFEDGKLVSGLAGKKLPVYLAAQVEGWLSEGKPIFVVEGEKDVLSLASRGFAATTKAGGSESAWEESNVEMFEGAEVTIVADKDAPGEKAAKAAYIALFPVAKSLKIVEAKQGKDATDHLDAGFVPAEFVVRDDLVPPPMTASGKVVTCSGLDDLEDEGAPEGVPSGFKGIDTQNESGGFPKGQMSVVCAMPKHGKSAFMCQATVNALKRDHRVLYVTLTDLTKAQIWRRMRRIETGWADAPTDIFKAEQWHSTISAMKAIWEIKIANVKDLGGSRDVEDIVEGIEALNRRHKFDLVVVDYAQKMTSRLHADRVRATEAVSSGMSFMAESRGFALLIGSQLSEDGKAWYSREFTADAALMFHINAPNGHNAKERAIKIELQRFGPCDFEFPCTWLESKLCFKEVEK